MIKVTNLCKHYWVSHLKLFTFKDRVANLFKINKKEKFVVLDNLNFEVKEGECLGVIGRNGSGKSTLIKILSGIFRPSSGEFVCEGRLVPFVELGVGFNAELSAYENVFLNAALIGLNKKQILEKYDKIVEFAGLSKFMDQKLKYFSSGMIVRLAFAIAKEAEAEVLLIDEILAVGDGEFQEKCARIFEEYRKQRKTIVLVSHDLGSIEKFCDKVLYLENGKQKALGDPIIVLAQYEKDLYE